MTGLSLSLLGPGLPTPRLADGVDLLGEFQGGGSIEPRFLIRRSDGAMLIFSTIVYRLAEELDGRADAAELAERISLRTGGSIDVAGVCYLLKHKLEPLGVVAGGGQQAGSGHSVLKLAGRTAFFTARAVRPAASLLRHLFHTPVVVCLLTAAVAVHLWLLHGGSSLAPSRDLLERPENLLVIVLVAFLGALFHEFGHAAASLYGGATPGVIGLGLYLVWPAFYTDITESYRLDRPGRIRTDLGGVYFNLLVTLPLAGMYGLTANKVWLWAILIQHLVILQQFMPFLRLDGYYLFSDLTGVPDLFGHIGPVFRSLLPGRTAADKVAKLRRGVRAAVVLWVVSTVCVLACLAGWLLLSLPRIVKGAGNLVTALWISAVHHAALGRGLASLANVIQATLVSIQLLGLAIMLVAALRLAYRSGCKAVERLGGNKLRAG